MIATVANMTRCEAAGVSAVVLDTVTGDTFSANPADYWTLPVCDPILDADGGACILARRIPERFEPVEL